VKNELLSSFTKREEKKVARKFVQPFVGAEKFPTTILEKKKKSMERKELRVPKRNCKREKKEPCHKSPFLLSRKDISCCYVECHLTKPGIPMM
jgi:hypothetical protein